MKFFIEFLKLDFGVENLLDFVNKTTFPWLMSNVIDNETNRPLGEGVVTHIISHKGKKVKLFFIEFLINFLINSIIIL